MKFRTEILTNFFISNYCKEWCINGSYCISVLIWDGLWGNSWCMRVTRHCEALSIHPVLKKDSNHAHTEKLAADPFSPEKKVTIFTPEVAHCIQYVCSYMFAGLWFICLPFHSPLNLSPIPQIWYNYLTKHKKVGYDMQLYLHFLLCFWGTNAITKPFWWRHFCWLLHTREVTGRLLSPPSEECSWKQDSPWLEITHRGIFCTCWAAASALLVTCKSWW